MGGGREQRHVPAGDVGTYGFPERRKGPRMGIKLGATNDDQVSTRGMFFLLGPDGRFRYGINNIRTLVGHKVSIEGIENSPAVRF
jgi:hypothetical protein